VRGGGGGGWSMRCVCGRGGGEGQLCTQQLYAFSNPPHPLPPAVLQLPNQTKPNQTKTPYDPQRRRAHDVYFGCDVFGRGTFGGGGHAVGTALRAARAAGASAALFAPGWTMECHGRGEFEGVQERWWRQVRLSCGVEAWGWGGYWSWGWGCGLV